MPSKVVELWAAAIRELFIAHMRQQEVKRHGLPSNYKPSVRWDGGVDSAGAHHASIWPQVATFVLKNGLDPQKFVAAQFSGAVRRLTPGILLTQEALARYRAATVNVVEELRADYAIQRHRATVEVACRMPTASSSELDAWIDVLWDQGMGFCPLFRYCCAAKLIRRYGRRRPLLQLAQTYRVAAAIQFERFPDLYQKIWGSLIPKNYWRRAGRLVEAASDKFEFVRRSAIHVPTAAAPVATVNEPQVAEADASAADEWAPNANKSEPIQIELRQE